ncbi:uncharacterized protein LOC128269862 [Anopheles cruzii]|uniref:uncharacterized protein LOC128269862 n=1 Tax=Anopheles cruzii TaxID=68878 RepID=UPI0022EC988D|nr:uncharacterized protein LOC128269862 [Anopheles cruzii]
MRTIVVWALALALVCPAVVARPNPAEQPIYLRRRSNPLEIVEESVEASGSHQQPADETGNGSTERVATDTTTSVASPDSTSPASTSASDSTPASDQRPTHQPSFALKRPSGELLKTKIGTSGFVVSTSTKVLTGGAPGSGGPAPKPARPAEGEGKANDQLTLFDRYTGHVGVAEPLTDEEYQNELHRATERAPLRTTTTPREGLSTWVLLSGSDTTDAKDDSTSPSSSSTRKASIAVTSSTTTPSTTKRYQPTVRRGPLPTTTTARPAKTTTVAAEEKKEKPGKPLPKQKVAAATTTLKPVVIVKKAKKPLPVAPGTTTTTSTTTTPATTSAASSTTEKMLSASVTDAPSADESIESSTFLILEPKDAMFDLPEDRSPTKVAAMPKPKKGATRKPNAKPGTKKKPGQKKTRKPEIKDGVAKPPTKSKPVSTQIINYLSREVMPTVGVGLVGLVMAAGLASYFLGSPLGALRRSDDRKDDLYYSNYEEYAGTQDGQNEEDVFGKLIAGMPDRSYYRNGGGNVRRRIATSQPVRTGHQYYHVQPYTGNKYPHITYRNRAYGGATGPEMYSNINRQSGGGGSVVPAPVMPQAKSQNSLEFHYTPPTPYYPPSRADMSTPAVRPPSAPVYSSPATTTTEAAAAVVPDHELASPERLMEPADHEMMPHPEAYSAEHSPEHHAHYVVGGTGPSGYSDAMLEMINAASMPEHGPRKKRSTSEESESDLDNEINVDDDDDRAQDAATPAKDVVPETTHGEGEPTTEEMMVVGDGPPGHRYTWGDFIRNTVERKVAMGISFLKHVTQDFQRYLNGVQDRFEGRQ